MKRINIVFLLMLIFLGLTACGEQEIGLQEPPATVGFAWEVVDGTAWLQGIGAVSEEHIVIPAKVKLSENAGKWEENEESGTEYPVTVTGDAFKNCEQLRTVTFHTSVQIEDNQMHKKWVCSSSV